MPIEPDVVCSPTKDAKTLLTPGFTEPRDPIRLPGRNFQFRNTNCAAQKAELQLLHRGLLVAPRDAYMHHLSRLRHVSPVLAHNMQTRCCPTFFLGAISVQHPNFSLAIGNDPIVAAALHADHQLRSEVEAEITLCPADRLREEDPYTDR